MVSQVKESNTNRMIYIRHDWFVKSGLAAREEMNCLLKNLTSRERVEIALEHKEPDRDC